MSVIFLAKGNCTMGILKEDPTKSTPAQFTADEDGGCIAIGELDPETMQPKEPVTDLYGDWDAAGYLAKVLELMKPRRGVNIPDLKAIVQRAYKEDGNDLICDYCQDFKCRDCIVNEWKEEAEDDS